MRIVYCIAGTRHSGGMERVLSNKANWLVGHGHEVFIVTTDQHNEQPFFHLDSRIRTIDLDINYEDTNGKSFFAKLAKYPFKQFQHRKRLAKLLKDLKADIVISMFCNDASFLPAIADGSAKILEIHFSRFKRLQYGRRGIWGLTDRLRSRMDQSTASRYDRFVVLTHEDSNNWNGLENLTVIPNARSFSAEAAAPLNNHTALAVGRLCHQKGFDRLIDIWRIVCNRVGDWKLLIVGSGELEQDILNRIHNLNLDDSVDIRPATAAEMPDIYRNASILIMTSRYEGLPMALIEAQACGLPIVTCDCSCGPKDIVDNGHTGYIVTDCDPETMAEKLVSLMTDSDLRRRMGQEAFMASEHYSENAIMQKWEHLFQSVKSK